MSNFTHTFWGRLFILLIILNLINLLPAFATAPTINFNIDGCYTGAFVSWKTVADGHEWDPTANDIKEFEKIIGRKLAIITYFRPFSYDEKLYDFPAEVNNTITKNNSVLFLTWEPRDCNTANPKYFRQSLLPDIIAGKYDEYIDKWAGDIKALNQPILLRFAQEMNCDNFSWSGAHNGGSAGGPKVYIDAYRYIHNRFIKAGVNNVLWVWTPIKWGIPFEPWNHYTNYYPGDEYVDIVAMDEYNWGTSQPWSKWESFNDKYWQLYSELTALYPTKTLIIGEFSCSEKGGDKPQWIKETFRDIKEKYPKIKAFVWQSNDNRNETYNNLLENSDWRINSSPENENIAAAQLALADKYFQDRINLFPPAKQNGY